MRGGHLISGSLVAGREADRHVCPENLKKFVLAVAVLGSSLGFIDGTIITVALAPIRDALGASFAAMQWVVNAYTLMLSAFLLIGGAAGDRYGRRRVFEAGIVVFSLGSIGCGLAPSVKTLIVARIVQGFGAALMVPGSLALIAVNFPEAERGRAVGIWAAASGVTAAIGPLVGGLLIDAGSWRAIFAVNVPIAVGTIVLLRQRVPDDRPRTAEGRFDLTGAIFAFLGVGLIAAGFTLAERSGLAAPGSLAALALGGVAFAGFLVREASAAHPMMPLDLFLVRLFSVANAQTLLVYFALGGALFFLPISLMEAHGWSAAAAGAVFLPFTLTMAVAAPLTGRAVDRVGVRLPLTAGPLIVAAAFVALAFVAAGGRFWGGVAPVMIALGAGMGIAIPPLSAAVLQGVGADRSGIASGVNNAIARVASLFAVAILGLLASLLYRAELAAAIPPIRWAVADLGFATPLPASTAGAGAGTPGQDALAAAHSAAILATFRAVSLACAAMCAAAALLAAIGLPPAPPAAARDVAAPAG